MNASDLVGAALERTEAAMVARDVDSLRWAQASLVGCLDWAAKAECCEQLVGDVLRMVTDELRVQREG